jgi:hypothetical protein
MPRFTTRSVQIEAVQWSGSTHLMSDAFRRAVLRYLPDGTVEIGTGDGPRPCKQGWWIVHGPDGAFSVMRAAAFEAMFMPYVAEEPTPQPAPTPIPARAEIRRKA